MTFASVTVRLTLAALLSAMLAFRPRRLSHTVKRNERHCASAMVDLVVAMLAAGRVSRVGAQLLMEPG